MNILFIVQSVVCVILISAILVQAKGTGLGSGFGSSSQTYHTKRGLEKVLFQATIGLAVAFIFLALLSLV